MNTHPMVATMTNKTSIHTHACIYSCSVTFVDISIWYPKITSPHTSTLSSYGYKFVTGRTVEFVGMYLYYRL